MAKVFLRPHNRGAGEDVEGAPKTFTVAAGWLIDGQGAPPLCRVLIRVEQGRIRAIQGGCGESEYGSADLDLSSSTLLPGLLDCHVHLALSGTEDAAVRKRQLSATYEEARGTIGKNLAEHLASGVVAVRDGGDREGHALQYRRTDLFREGATATRISCGQAFHAPNRYGSMIGHSPQGARLASAIKSGFRGDFVKIIHSGPNSLSHFGRETLPQFDPDDLRDGVKAAHDLGLKVMVHANGRLPVREAIDAGCDSVEHGYFMGKENLRRLADQGIAWIPTVFAMEALSRWLHSRPDGEVARRNVDHQLEQIRLARDHGVRIVAGTDAGSPGVHHGKGLREELRLLVAAGMSREEAVQCATSRGAEWMGLRDLGRLSPGAAAAFVVLKGGPDRWIESLESPQFVFSGIQKILVR
jgi:imidazolonepropionase-like amidohydrolase